MDSVTISLRLWSLAKAKHFQMFWCEMNYYIEYDIPLIRRKLKDSGICHGTIKEEKIFAPKDIWLGCQDAGKGTQKRSWANFLSVFQMKWPHCVSLIRASARPDRCNRKWNNLSGYFFFEILFHSRNGTKNK